MDLHDFEQSGYQPVEEILMPTLYRLDNLRRIMEEEEWKEFCLHQPVNFHLHQLLLNDPFTKRAFELQEENVFDTTLRRYLAGGVAASDIDPNQLGSDVFEFVYSSDFARAIRHKNTYVMEFLGQFKKAFHQFVSLLSISGSLSREDPLAVLLAKEAIDLHHIFKFRQEKCSLNHQSRNRKTTELIFGSIDRILFQEELFDQYQLIYSEDLMNAFDRKSIMISTSKLFNKLASKGCLLLVTFRENVSNSLFRTYLEAFGNCFFHYHKDEELIDFLSEIDPNEIADIKLATDPCCNISYLHVYRK